MCTQVLIYRFHDCKLNTDRVLLERVLGVETEGADCLYQSKLAGHSVRLPAIISKLRNGRGPAR